MTENGKLTNLNAVAFTQYSTATVRVICYLCRKLNRFYFFSVLNPLGSNREWKLRRQKIVKNLCG